MKKSGILNAQLLSELTKLRHGDKLLICGAGFPIPVGGNVVDSALVGGIPDLPQTLKAVLNEMVFESYVIMNTLAEKNPEYYQLITQLFQAQTHVEVPMEEFIILAQDVKLFIRTGELRSASNLMLASASGTPQAVALYDISIKE